MSFIWKETSTSDLFNQFNHITVYKCKPLGFHYGNSEGRTICPAYVQRTACPLPQPVQITTEKNFKH